MNDKDALRYAANKVRDQLIPPPRGIRLRPQVKPKDSYTRGWRVELAGMGVNGSRLELWLDHWANPNRRTFWFGFYASEPSKLKPTIKQLPDYLQPRREFSDRDMKEAGQYNHILNIPLKPGEFGPPFYEEYKQGYTYYGKFDAASPGDIESIDRLGQRAASFFRDVLKYQIRTQTMT
jgi:hypothetical protein